MMRTGGATTEPFSAVWGGALKVRATVLTPCDEVITYHTPAWRNPHEVFAAPGKSFDTLVLRNVGRKSRFVAVYEVFEGRTSLLDVRLDECEPDVLLHLKLRDGTKYETKIGGGGDDWSIMLRKDSEDLSRVTKRRAVT